MKKIKKQDNLTITEEEIKTNHIVQSKNAYVTVFSIMFLTVFLLLVGTLFKTSITPDYPIVFKDANNKLMVITKSSNISSDITKAQDADIVYANKDIRHILYTSEKQLHLLDTTNPKDNFLLSSNAVKYGFSSDDEVVYYIEANGDLHIYIVKSATDYLIDTNVTDTIDIVDEYVLYEKKENLTLKDYEKGTIEVISKSYEEVSISSNGKLILYNVLDKEDKTYDYYVYTFQTSNNEKVLSDVVELLSTNYNFSKFIYLSKSEDELNIYKELKDTESTNDKKFIEYKEEDVRNNKISKDDFEKNKEDSKKVKVRNEIRDYVKNYVVNGYDIYYQNKSTKTILVQGINQIYLDNIDDRKIVYTKSSWTNDIDIAQYESLDDFKKALEEKKKNALYYQVGTDEASLISESVSDDIEVTFIKGDGIYYTEYNNLYYSEVSGKKAKENQKVDENVLTTDLSIDNDLGLIYLTNEKDNNSLKYIKDGKYKIINQNVYEEYWVISERENLVYYIKDYENHKGSLMIFNGIRNSKVSDNISSLIYINDDLMYVTQNYKEDTKTSDLYRVNGNKLTLIYEGMKEWYNPIKDEQKGSN